MAKRKALGKGLSALIPDAHELEDSEIRFFQCPVEAIEPNPYQPRQSFSAKELDEMVNSVREKGIITPLLVSKTEAVVVREATPTESLELALIENIHRKDLNPIEEALAYRKLLEETGVTQDALAKRLGRERSSMTNVLRLLKLPVFIQKDVIDGRLHMGHARVLAGLKNREAQKALRDKIIEKGLSVRQAETLAKAKKVPGRITKKDAELDYYFQSLADDLKRSLGTKVDIKKGVKGGHIVVYFYSDEELDRLLELLT
ncbi:MAG: ParB/RepB/Spo0J family partition protein [Deltaproteobacteria bacterium]|nr:ParB/RepB/Spo0J family partition protein [Deltaproteobacteria bacterium]